MIRREVSHLENALATVKSSGLKMRCEAVLLRLEGWEVHEVCEDLGCSPRAVSAWTATFRNGGVELLCSEKKLGRPPIVQSEKMLLAKSIVAQSQSNKRPARGFDLCRRFQDRGILMCLATVYNLLHRLNFSYQTCRPVNPNQDQTVVKTWKEALPGVINTVQEANPGKILKVFFMDEARFGQQGIQCKQWSQVGDRPTRVRQHDYKNAWIYGAACAETGQSRFLVTTSVGIEFMQIFLADFSKSLGSGVHAMMILDNAIWHSSAKIKVPSNVTIHFQPSYSPEVNPMETLWDFMKDNFLCNQFYRNTKEIIEKGCEACKRVTAEIVKSVCHRNYVPSCAA
jgi:transposase